jgi:DNA-binding transcriptional regulator/RsmH inhibitor MraZ
MLSQKQTAIAGITRNITLIGNYDYIEIWDTDTYNRHIGAGDDFDEVFFQSVETGLQVHHDKAE